MGLYEIMPNYIINSNLKQKRRKYDEKLGAL